MVTWPAVGPVADAVVRAGPTGVASVAVPATGIAGAPGLVLLHGFPTRGRESEQSGKSFPELAERIASELGWVVLTVNFRGCGAAEGDFSLVGWLDDVHAVLMSWFPGQEMGNALVDLLSGAAEPQGRLPVSFPFRLEDTPAFEHNPGRNGVASLYSLA